MRSNPEQTKSGPCSAIEAESLGDAFRQLRPFCAWNRQGLARWVGVSRQWLRRFETGAADVRIARVEALFRAIGYRIVLVPARGEPFVTMVREGARDAELEELLRLVESPIASAYPYNRHTGWGMRRRDARVREEAWIQARLQSLGRMRALAEELEGQLRGRLTGCYDERDG